MKKYFITATGTDIGKTYYLCKLIKEILAKNQKVKAIKPIISGLDINNIHNSDSGKIISALKKEVTIENILNISPFFYQIATSPDSAALIENKQEINYAKLLEFCSNFLKNNSHDYALIEGVGGIMVPINSHKLILDLIKDLKIEVILITKNYLGTRNHTLNSLEILKLHNIRVNKIILNNFGNDQEDRNLIIKSLKNFTNIEIESI
jgi:dethiobiotin synthetase